MYIIQQEPDKTALMKSGSEVIPLMTLKDEYGGISHIIEDDHCYVLINGAEDRPFGMSHHWYEEAACALTKLMNEKSKLNEDIKRVE